MWWVLLAVVILVGIENRTALKTGAGRLLDPRLYFWLVLNLVVLSFVASWLLPQFSAFLNTLSLRPLFVFLNHSVVLQFFVFLIIIDFVKFGTHYLMHKFNFLWKIHLIHHSSEDITTLASFKHSWLEAFINLFLSSLLSKIFVIDLSVLTVINAILLSACIWQHTKIKYLSVPVLSAVFVTPKNHRIHHELRNDSLHCNYGLIFTIWDRVFGTFSPDETNNPKYGIIEPGYPRESNIRQFFYPFIR